MTTCATCGREFVTTFTLPTDECDDCFGARMDAEAAQFDSDSADLRQMRRDEEAASDRFTGSLATLNYRIEPVAS